MPLTGPADRTLLSHNPRFVRWLRRNASRTLVVLALHLVILITPLNAVDEPVTVRHTEGLVHGFLVLRTMEGKALADGDLERKHLDVPPDLANGMITTVLKNVRADAPPKSFSFVAATPKPQLVKLAVSVAGAERFSTGSTGRTATHYVLKVEIGGLQGLLAPLVGKQPPDAHVWILDGEAPAFLKSEQPLFPDGPVWRIELVSPAWPASQSSSR